MVNLVPSNEEIMDILTESGAYRKGHFKYPNGKHASHYFQMPLAFHYYNNARVLSVGLSRLFRMEKSVSSRLPKVSVVSPGPGGIMVAFGVREALNAHQVYWAETDSEKRQFRQFITEQEVYPAIIVDDIMRSGKAIEETIDLLKELNTEVIGIGTIVRFEDGPSEFDGIPVKSLLTFDVNYYDTQEDWEVSRNATPDAEIEDVR